jgi:hypothetical protein
MTEQSLKLSTGYRKALAERSSYVENVLTHRLVGALAAELWRRNPSSPLTIFNAEVDDSGFDLVLAWEQRLRYLQIKQVHVHGGAAKFSIRQDFSLMTGSCVVVIVHTEDTLDLDHFLFYGGRCDQAMPSIQLFKASAVPGRRDALGQRKVRSHYRDIRRTQFKRLGDASALVDALFA